MVQKTIVFVFAFLLFVGQFVCAQEFKHTIEIGPTIGSSFYLGDANGTWMKNSQPAFGGVIRYPLDTRFAVSVEALTSNIAGQYNGSKFNNPYFYTGAQVEFNFFSYDRYDLTLESSTISPYILGGIGIVIYKTINIQGTIKSDSVYTDQPTNNLKSSPVLSGGIGVKFKLSNRLDLNCQWTMNKTFADNLEGVGQLNDPNKLNKSAFLNNDYFSVLSISLTIALNTQSCHCTTDKLKGY
jgi:hypothetical protein